MLCTGCLVPDVSEDRSSFDTSGPTPIMTQHLFPENLNLQCHHCGNLKSGKECVCCYKRPWFLLHSLKRIIYKLYYWSLLWVPILLHIHVFLGLDFWRLVILTEVFCVFFLVLASSCQNCASGYTVMVSFPRLFHSLLSNYSAIWHHIDWGTGSSVKYLYIKRVFVCL
jgi:hypothetical protein